MQEKNTVDMSVLNSVEATKRVDVFLLEEIGELENFSNNAKMETSTEKQLSVSNRSCNLLSKAVKRVDKFQQSTSLSTRNIFFSELNLVVSNDKSCQTNFQRKIDRSRYNEDGRLISALNKHIQSLEKQ